MFWRPRVFSHRESYWQQQKHAARQFRFIQFIPLNFHQKDAVTFFTHTQQLTAASSQLPCLCYKSFHHLWKVNVLCTLPCVWNALQCPQFLGAALQFWLLSCCNKTDETTSESMCDTTHTSILGMFPNAKRTFMETCGLQLSLILSCKKRNSETDIANVLLFTVDRLFWPSGLHRC